MVSGSVSDSVFVSLSLRSNVAALASIFIDAVMLSMTSATASHLCFQIEALEPTAQLSIIEALSDVLTNASATDAFLSASVQSPMSLVQAPIVQLQQASAAGLTIAFLNVSSSAALIHTASQVLEPASSGSAGLVAGVTVASTCIVFALVVAFVFSRRRRSSGLRLQPGETGEVALVKVSEKVQASDI